MLTADAYSVYIYRSYGADGSGEGGGVSETQCNKKQKVVSGTRSITLFIPGEHSNQDQILCLLFNTGSKNTGIFGRFLYL